jgi:hypothetical protein
VKHEKEELKEWSLSFPTTEDLGVTDWSSCFYLLIDVYIYTRKNPTFFEKELMQKFLQFLDQYMENHLLRLTICYPISELLPYYPNAESAFLFVNFVMEKVAKFDEKNLQNSNKNYFILCRLVPIILKHFPTNDTLIKELANTFVAYLSSVTKNDEKLVKCIFSAYLMLTGDKAGFIPCRMDIEQMATHEAIEVLCKFPHPDNLKKAQRILFTGATGVLKMEFTYFRESNRIFVQTLLANNLINTLDQIIPLIFQHLCFSKQEDDVFTMTKVELTKYLKELSKKPENSTLSLNITDSTYASYRQQRIDLINFNIMEILERYPSSVDIVMAILNSTVFCFLQEDYQLYPKHLDVIMEIIVRECKKQHAQDLVKEQQVHRAVAILLCSHSYIPAEPWETFFRKANFTHLFEDIVSAKKYFKKLESLKSNRSKLLELRPDNGQIELTLTPDSYDKELSMRSQWIKATSSVFLYSDFDQYTLEWMSLIKNEILQCMILGPNSILDSITTPILFILFKIFKRIEIEAKTDPDFANRWMKEWIETLSKHITIDKHKWFLALIETYLQETITPELIPCLPYLEKFSSELSQIHKDRCCIDAYVKLLFHGCRDDWVINKAIENASKLLIKISIRSINYTTKKKIACFTGVTNEEFSQKFEMIYLVAIEKMMKSFKEHKDFRQFAIDFDRIRKNTDMLLKNLDTKSTWAYQVSRIFYDHLHLFTEAEAMEKVINYLDLVNGILKFQYVGAMGTYADTRMIYLTIALFYGPDSDNPKTNKYLESISNEIIPLLAKYDISSCDVIEFVHLSIKSMILQGVSKKNTDTFVNLSFASRRQAIEKPKYRELYLKAMEDLTDELKRFISLRPQLESWYNLWVQSAQSEIDFVIEKSKEIDILAKKASQIHPKTRVVIK